MNNHFGKGLMAGLKATHADSAVNVTKYCADYKRGFVLGYHTGCTKRPEIASLAPGSGYSDAPLWTG